MYYADDQYYDDSYAYDDDKDDESYDVEDGCDELCESFDGICETKSVLRGNQSANNDVLNVKAQSNVINDVKVQTNNVNAVKLNDYVNVARKVLDVYTKSVVDNQMQNIDYFYFYFIQFFLQNIDDYDDYRN